MTTTINSHEGEVAAALDGSSGGAVRENVVLKRGLLEVLVAGPLEGLGPGLVSEPVACKDVSYVNTSKREKQETNRCSPKNQRKSGQESP